MKPHRFYFLKNKDALLKIDFIALVTMKTYIEQCDLQINFFYFFSYVVLNIVIKQDQKLITIYAANILTIVKRSNMKKLILNLCFNFISQKKEF